MSTTAERAQVVQDAHRPSAETAHFDVYQRGTLTSGRWYFEHKVYGDSRCAVAIVENKAVVDLDACAVLNEECAEYLRTLGISTAGSTVSGK